jgi:sialate O-acetylesterase
VDNIMKNVQWMMMVAAGCVLPPASAAGRLELPRVFGDGMVVQRDKPAHVWGWGEEGAAITVEFNGQTGKTIVGDDGKWMLTLEPMPANAKPQAMTVKGGTDAVTLGNVLIGDVWLCSGQSNMEADAGGIIDSDLDMPQAGRIFRSRNAIRFTPSSRASGG